MPHPTLSSSQATHIPGLAPEATPVIGMGLGLAGLLLGVRPRLVALPLLATATAALLFRDPERTTPADSAALFAAADGVVSAIDELYEHRFLHTDAVRLTITRSLFDVHVTRSPAAGLVRYLETNPQPPRAREEQGERSYIGIHTPHGPVLIMQVADALTRRTICRVGLGDEVAPGERIGLARFGSRVDVILPRDVARLDVLPGQRLRAGVTRIATLI
jgi:phosphatidylserine decarboxylase